jgi:methyl-accepting chemotaxis protein
MADKAAISDAIGAHGMWKGRLKLAIESGKSELPVESIRTDNHCVFGQWLHGSTLTSADKASPHFKTVRDRHAEFHRTAARVVELAMSGDKTEASKMMSFNGEFTAISAKLTAAMMEWKKSLG